MTYSYILQFKNLRLSLLTKQIFVLDTAFPVRQQWLKIVDMCWPRPGGTPTSAGSAAASSTHGATAIAAPNLSLGAALFLRLAELAAGWYARAGSFEPSIVEWHRRARPTARPAPREPWPRRIVAADPRWPRATRSTAARSSRSAGIRAGAAPGTHLVTFDGRRRVDRAPPGRARPLGLRRAAPWRPPGGSSVSPASPACTLRRRRGRPPRRRRPLLPA